MRSKNRMLAGVLAGIAEHWDLDPTVVRVIFVILSLASVGFPGLLVYLIMWIIMPEQTN